MATTVGRESMMGATGTQVFDESSMQAISLPAMLDTSASSTTSFSGPRSPRTMPPLPNPPFVFPARPSSASAPSSFSRATGRRPLSAIETQGRSTFSMTADPADRPSKSPALPNFTFNPGASLSPDTNSLLSPPLSPPPVSPRLVPSPSRPTGVGHRRGGSEFVGGSIRSGDSITVTGTSPTRSESGFASPNFQLPPPNPGARRGHAHRRSAALSSHDLSLIVQPPAPGNLRGNSAPTSPAEFDRRLEDHNGGLVEKTLRGVESELALKVPTELTRPVTADSGTSSGRASPAARPVTRTRVGFSDTLEFIPRPLSMVSSDTSSTVTARPGGHSVSGSISSIISIPATTNPESEPVIPLVLTPSRQNNESRPSTAGAVLERSQSIQSVGASPRRRNSIPTLINVPEAGSVGPPMPSPTKTPKRWSFFGLDPFAAAASPLRTRPVSSSSSESGSKPHSSASSSSFEHVLEPPGTPETSEESGQRTDSKKPKRKKKVKNWAGSILARKNKPRNKKCKDLDLSGDSARRFETIKHKDDSLMVEPEVNIEPVTPTLMVTDTSSQPQNLQEWKPRPVSAQDDSSFSMIDLDAALGPFNTPIVNNPEWDAAQRAAASTKRQLHSAQGMKGFSGPGMHYHRRAESAPEMVPFEGARFGIHRFGSSSTMADVFEEDEEDDDHTGKSASLHTNSGRGTAQDSAESSGDEATPPATDIAKKPILDTLPVRAVDDSCIRGGPIPNKEATKAAASMKSEKSLASLQDNVIVEEPSRADVPEFRTGSIFQEKAESTGSATPSPRRILASKDLAPVDVSPLHLPTLSHVPVSPYSMSHASSFPSPRSPMSYDAQRISTAPSSVNEENNFQSLLLGEPGPEVRLSVDIPSLTSSHSTMTRDSSFAPSSQLRQDPIRPDQQRPVSVSSAAFGRRRSSLASLSRLISSSHGERSKLSMEVSYDGEGDKKHKSSKSKRLSRMMRFWKPKDDTSA
ncbi:cell wall proline rich protein [Colletotrichum higginsianum]|uniref:Cell wall proline rich protein n=1 Tax=Colletotrichum higginsianum (strain IMI 349063) TaxID=759273 RepID=H1UZJ0_COLHI|nr:Cell wall proline rich protein [Colletotrichum higginsianum IMI 349063]OBR15513.1 Cell wall proline rich protein [Colletotrichum higginsianum IMI 349063]CCF33391.1 cell wall proline rich protein [Colletotrichum higginsianum]